MDYKKYIYELREAAEYFQNTRPDLPDIISTYKKSADIIEALLVEYEGAIDALRGECHACKNNSGWHNIGKCATCKHETTTRFLPGDSVTHVDDNWQWRGNMNETMV